jgi:hypothetical protein
VANCRKSRVFAAPAGLHSRLRAADAKGFREKIGCNQCPHWIIATDSHSFRPNVLAGIGEGQTEIGDFGRLTISQPNPGEGTRVSDLCTADHGPSSPINEFGVTPGCWNLERSTPGAPK